MTQIDLSFLNQGKELSFSVAQLQAMDAELQAIASKAPELIALSRAFGITYDAAAKLTAELKLQPAQLQLAVSQMQALRAVGADGATQYAIFAKTLGLSVDQMRMLSDEVGNLSNQQPAVESLQQALGQLFILDKADQFRQSVLETGKAFETLNTRLKTTLGTQAAATEALGRISDFAATTPFELQEVTDVFVNLKQRGIEPTNEALRNLGDIASSQSKSLSQASEALLDASQGEFERLREFGIRASAAGDKVNISFQGVNSQVSRTPEAISAGILALGKLDGVAGGMAEQAKTLGGSLSNLSDAQNQLTASTFALIQPMAVGFVQAATSLLNSFQELDPLLQRAVLSVGVLGSAFSAAVIAVAAFQAAQVGVALSTAAATIAKGPAAAATVALAAATRLAAVAETDLTRANTIGAVASAAKTAATNAQTAATTANAAATAASGKSLLALAAGAATAAGAILAAVASIALVAETFATMTKGEREAAESSAKLAESFEAIDQATLRRKTTQQALADAEASAAEATRRNALSASELAAENAANDAKYAEAYEKHTQERLGLIQSVLDKVREFVNLPNQAFVRTFELLAKLPAPKFVQDFLQGVADQLDQFRLRTAKESLIDSDTVGLGIVEQDLQKLSQTLASVRESAGGNLADASKQEVEALDAAYGKMIETLEAQVPANQRQATARDLALRQIQAEREEITQSAKLISERSKRVASAGTAEEQWAAEVAKVTSNLAKQIATSEDAQKLIETTKQQLEGGFIDAEAARQQFEQVAGYTSAAADVQVAAAQELRALRERDTDFQQAELEAQIAQIEAAGLAESRAAEATAADVAAIRAEQAELTRQALAKTLAEEQAAGRGRGQIARQAAVDLAKATADASKAATEATQASQAAAIAEANDAVEDAARTRAEAEANASIAGKAAVLAAVRSGNSSIEEAEREAGRRLLEVRRSAIAEEIAQKTAAQAELSAIGGDEAKDQAEKLGSELLKLREQQLDLEIEAVRKAQAEQLQIIAEAQERRKALQAQDTANDQLDLAQQELAVLRRSGADRAELEREIAQTRLDVAEETAAELAAITEQELAETRQAVADGVITQKDGAERILQLETELADKRTAVVRAQINQTRQAEAEKLRLIEESFAQQRRQADIAASAAQIQQTAIADVRSLLAAEERLANARRGFARSQLGSARQELETRRDIAKARGDERTAASLDRQIGGLELRDLQEQRSAIAEQFELKRQSLELDIQSAQIAAEQLLIEKQLAALEAEQAVAAAKVQGKSKEEIAALQAKAELSQRALGLAQQAAEQQNRISGAQRETLELERATALNDNSSQQRRVQGQRQAQGGTATTSSDQSGARLATTTDTVTRTFVRLTAPVEGAAKAADVLAGSLSNVSNALAQVPKVAGARADGGPVVAGNAYLVGERGPELVRFGQTGQVFSNEQLTAALAQSDRAAPPSVDTASLLAELQRLNAVVLAKASSPDKITVPLTVYHDVQGAAEALQLIRADRALRNKGAFG